MNVSFDSEHGQRLSYAFDLQISIYVRSVEVLHNFVSLYDLSVSGRMNIFSDGFED